MQIGDAHICPAWRSVLISRETSQVWQTREVWRETFDKRLCQRQIDALVYELYDLAEEEIAIVEQATA